MKTQLTNDIHENARVLKMKGVETIDVERPPVMPLDKEHKVVPKLIGRKVNKLTPPRQDDVKNLRDFVALITSNACEYHHQFMYDENIEFFIMQHDIEWVLDEKIINQAIQVARSTLGNSDALAFNDIMESFLSYMEHRKEPDYYQYAHPYHKDHVPYRHVERKEENE